MQPLIAVGVFDLMPGFSAGCRTLNLDLIPVAFVESVCGTYFHLGLAYAAASAKPIKFTLARLLVVVILLGSFGDWGNLLTGTVQGVIQTLGVTGGGLNPGSAYDDYRAVIINEFGSDSAAQSQQQLYQAVQSQGTAQSQGLSAPVNTTTHFTRYGYPGDSTPDTNSENGIGNHSNQLVPGQSVAISNKLAQQYGLQVGQSVQFTTSSGQTYTGTYDDTVPDGVYKNPTTGQISLTPKEGYTQYIDESNNIDLYDPNGQLTNLDGAAITGINGTSAPAGASNALAAQDPGLGGWIKRMEDALTSWVVAPFAYVLSVIALGIMWIMVAAQQILFLIEVAVSPIFIGMLMIPALVPLASRFFTSFVALCIFPLGFAIADLVTKGFIDLATNPVSNTALAVFDGFQGAFVLWIFIALWVIVSYLLVPFIAGFAFVSGSSGAGALIGAAFGATAGALNSRLLYRSFAMGAAAVRAAGKNGNGSEGNGTNAPAGVSSVRRQSLASRPPREEEGA
jgi:hypothetical protein